MAKNSKLKTFTFAEVAKHNTATDCWIVIDGFVYDVTKFMKLHPGGSVVLREVAGSDTTAVFFGLHRSDVLDKYKRRLCIGRLDTQKTNSTPGKPFPYAESSAWSGWNTPYYTDSHRKFRTAVRAIVDRDLKPIALRHDNSGKDPTPETFLKLGQTGMLACRLGPGAHLKDFALPGGIPWQEFDYFHESILHEEMARLGCPGFFDGIGGGMVIGLPPVLNHGKPALKAKVANEVLRGQKKICLAITEPFAGSDVAGLRCVAEKSACGKFYIVSGVKKWITNGMFCDYFTTAVRTGNKISLLLIEKDDTVSLKRIKTSYSPCAGTAYIEFDRTKVPVENLLGKENEGFKAIMTNFNHERWFIIVYMVRLARLMVEESFKWANQRKVFGKRLIDQPVIRNKLGDMVSDLEAVQAWVDLTTHQMNTMSYKDQVKYLAGGIALLKFKCTRMAWGINDNITQIFGGRAITQSGMGIYIEKFMRFSKVCAVYGGSEEILVDLAVRQAMKYFPKNARL